MLMAGGYRVAMEPANRAIFDAGTIHRGAAFTARH
jgi:hypothetical protein